MFNSTGRMLALLLAAPLVFVSLPTHAQYACSGPGPGEIMIGMTPGGNGIAPTPLCAPAPQGDGGYQQAPATLPNVYMTVVGHPDTNRLWISRGFASQDAAEKVALNACTQALGEGCSVGSTWFNDARIVAVQDVAGNLYVKGAATSWRASGDADDDCEKFSSGCHKVETIKNSFNGEEVDFPKGPFERRRFGALARPKGKAPEKWDDSAWLVTGQDGYKAAEDTALAQCRKDTGMDCELRVSAGNGYIARMVNQKGQIYWWNAPSLEMLDKGVRNNCPKGEACRIVDTFDVRPASMSTIEVSVSKAPLRGFMSLARPDDDEAAKAWSKRAFVAGQPSLAAAQAAAVAMCEKDSGAKCVATPKDGDNGVDQFLVLMRATDGTLKSFWGTSADDARRSRDRWCTEQKQQCSDGMAVDLAKKNAGTFLQI